MNQEINLEAVAEFAAGAKGVVKSYTSTTDIQTRVRISRPSGGCLCNSARSYNISATSTSANCAHVFSESLTVHTEDRILMIELASTLARKTSAALLEHTGGRPHVQ